MEELNQQEIIRIHLDSADPALTIDYSIVSTLATLNREINHALSNNRSKNILPIIGAMAIIEQLGECYTRTDMHVFTNNNASSLKKGLYYFGNKLENDPFIETIYALRNGLVHNASFYSVDRYENGRNYNFTYDDTIQDVYLPASVAWDGRFQNISETNFTLINPRKLVEFTSDMIRNVSTLNQQQGVLQVQLADGLNELIFRYLKWRARL